MTFITKILEAFAWPATTIALVILLRSEIRQLLPFVKKLKAGPVEAEFERDVKALKHETPVIQQEIAERPTPDSASKDFLIQLAELHPRSAILESWVRLEAAARAVLAEKLQSNSAPGYLPAARLAEPLVQRDAISQPQVTLFHELRRLRNEVAHSPEFEPTDEAAKAYVDVASFLQGHLEGQIK
ncbi:MAG: hypothetical protein JSR66_04430 [Proteobacteria bacterium]|nr:hypothetical protein [Pseudomonadota bacterium]